MTNSTNKPTTAFWVLSILALIWNIMGVIAYLGQAYMTDEIKAALPKPDQDYYANVPAWVTAAFAIAVFAGAFACLLLLLRKKWATSLFILSLIAVLVQFVYNSFMQDFMEVTGQKMIWSFVVIAISIFLVWYSKKSESKGWIS